MIGVKERLTVFALSIAARRTKGATRWLILSALELLETKNRELKKLKGAANG